MFESYISYALRQPIPTIPVFLNLFPIILIFKRKGYRERTILLLLVYLIIKFLIDFVMFDWAAQKKNTVILYNINVPVRYLLVSGMYYFQLQTRPYKMLVLVMMPLFTLFSIWDILHINPTGNDLYHHNMVLYSTTVESLLMIFWVLLYFYDTIRTLKIPNLLTYPFFWICSGLLIYYSSFLFIAPVLHYSSKWEDWLDFGFLAYFPYIFESVSIVLFSIGIYQYSPKLYAKH
ncbi:hypothetical protein [Dyadobacter sandarakinus]|uniref:Lycopene cyclase domain-containing protein n=1 Tax=Dyadobacter sandarakinus TaxID=2747268 RepID=A0ABX7I887_9BACT|nr:hypothetical protein [Dyadobacter sandarakinus]QRR01948.1 hypothetical protein HWI92_14035 [Dyadobacter sandarakinus]